MQLIRGSTQRPVTVFIGAVAAVVFGSIALSKLATDLLPDISYPSLTVRTVYHGTAPAEIESLITRPVENAVGVINGVVRVTSSSRADISEVTLEFGWDTNMDMAGLDVRERLDVMRLPADSERPLLLRYDPSLDPILRLGVHGDEDLIRLRLLAEEEVKRALERIEGIAAVVVSGGLEEEIQVELDERKLANLGLTVERVSNRLAQENVNVTGGRLREGQSEYLVRTLNEIVRTQDLNDVVLSADGAIVRLQDVAKVVRGHKERDVITRIDGEESVEVAIYKEGGTNTVTVSNLATAGIEALRQRLEKVDPRLQLTVVSDQARFIRSAVSEVFQTAAIGGLLAILVLFFFLRSWKATSIIAIAIPISVVGTFFLMYTTDISLNIMSLGGLTLGIGLLVDNAIVVLEAIQRRRDQGLDDLEAAIAGASEVGTAVTASTLTTICVFLPIVFVEGIAGQLFSDQAITVAFSLVLSLVVALTVIPMLASRRLVTRADLEPVDPELPTANALQRLVSRMLGGIGVGIALVVRALATAVSRITGWVMAIPLRLFGTAYDGLAAAYGRILDGVLRRPALVVLAALLLLGGSLSLYPGLGKELVPELVQGEFFVNTELPPGTRLEVTDSRMARLESAASKLDGVGTRYALIGTSNAQGGVAGELRENTAQLTLRVPGAPSREHEDAMMRALRQTLDRDSDLEYRFGRPSYFSFRTPVEVEIRGHNLKLLQRLSDQLIAQMREIDGLTDVEASTEGGHPELVIHFRRDRLAQLGLGIAEVATTLRAKVQGDIATEIHRDDRQIEIRVRSDHKFRDSVTDLQNLAVAQRGKTSTPLSAVADVIELDGPAEIRRVEGHRAAIITGNLVGRDLGSVSEEIQALLDATSMPAGFSGSIGGQQQEMQTSFDSMRQAILLAVFLVYLVMASQFESLLHPFVILLCVPFSLIGVLFTLWALNVTVSVVVLIGAILLTGIVVNDAIILIDFTNQRRREGVAKLAALAEAGRVRLRPILMTTATTVLGLLPMALGLGEGAELRTPMALTVIGGITASTALTLLVIPAVYALLDRRP